MPLHESLGWFFLINSSLIARLDIYVLLHRPHGVGGVLDVADLPPQDLLPVPLRPVVAEDTAGPEARGAAPHGLTMQVLTLLGCVANSYRKIFQYFPLYRIENILIFSS